MSKLKAIIVDDERLSRVNLKRMLEPHDKIEIVGEAGSYNSAIEVIGQLKPDLIFLDIQLRGKTGFDLIKVIDSSVKIVFVTAIFDFMVYNFGLNSVDYLLKPINPERLKLVVAKIFNMESEQINNEIYEYA